MTLLFLVLLIVLCAVDLHLYELYQRMGLIKDIVKYRQWHLFFLTHCPGGCILLSIYFVIYDRFH